MRLGFSHTFLLATTLVLCGSTLQIRLAWGQAEKQESAARGDPKPDSPPPLSLETIYGSDQRYDYDGPSAPTHRWVEHEGSSRLAIRREAGWQLRDPGTGEASAWVLPQRLSEAIAALPEVTDKQAAEVAERLLRSSQQDFDRLLVRIGEGYALVGLNTTARWITREASRWRDATLSPAGTHLAYTAENDLHLYEIATGATRALTTNGSETQLNGILDWSYQEELYGRGNFKAFWWSPDGRKLAFLRLRIGDVHEYTIADSATPRGGTLVARYPKVGDPIPQAELWLADLAGTLQPVHRFEAESREHLIVRVSWHPDSQRIAYQVTDRLQSWLELRLANVFLPRGDPPSVAAPFGGEPSGVDGTPLPKSSHQTLLRDSSPAWVEVLGEPIWLNDDDFLWLSDQPLGRRRLWRINELGNERVPVTPESFVVRSLGDLAAEKDTILVYGDAERGTVGQQLYRAALPPGSEKTEVGGANSDGQPRSQTNSSTVRPGWQRLTQREGWHSVLVDPSQRWMVDTFSTLTSPPQVRLLPLPGSETSEREARNASDETYATADEGVLLHESAKLPSHWVLPEWMKLSVGDGLELPAYVLKPRQLRGRAPVLIETYGGPLAPSAVDRWSGTSYLYRQLLVKQGIAVMVVDNRSSAGHGIFDTWSIHRQMGVVELRDVLAFVDWLKTQDWVDAEHLGIRGWSFGGYLTAFALTHSDAFAAGVAGGAPTDWRNYDAIYTERYMGLPAENPEGYEKTSVVQAADKLHGRLLLIHGELDDNVHAANTLQLAAAFQKAGKQFDLMIYPGSAHGVQHGPPTYHMMKMVTDFLLRYLDP